MSRSAAEAKVSLIKSTASLSDRGVDDGCNQRNTQNEDLDGKSVTKGEVQTGRREGQCIAKVKSAIAITVTQASKTHLGWKDKRACRLQLIIEHRHDELHASTLGAVPCTLV